MHLRGRLVPALCALVLTVLALVPIELLNALAFAWVLARFWHSLRASLRGRRAQALPSRPTAQAR